MDYRERDAFGAMLPERVDPEPSEAISNVNWPHRSREHDRAVRWLLGSPAERAIMRDAQIVMMLMRDALLFSSIEERPCKKQDFPGHCRSNGRAVGITRGSLCVSEGEGADDVYRAL